MERLQAATIFSCPHCRSLVTVPDPRPSMDDTVNCECSEPTEVRQVLQYWSYLRPVASGIAPDLMKLFPQRPDFRIWYLN